MELTRGFFEILFVHQLSIGVIWEGVFYILLLVQTWHYERVTQATKIGL